MAAVLQNDTPKDLLERVKDMHRLFKETDDNFTELSADRIVHREYEECKKMLADERNRLNSAIESGILSERERIVMRMYMVREYTVSEIADELGLSEFYIKMIIENNENR